MADQLFAEEFDDSKILASLDRIEKGLKETGKAGDEAANGMREAFSEAEKQVDSLGQTLGQTSKQVSNQAQAVKAAQATNQSWLQSIRQTIAGQQIGGKTLGEWADQASGWAQRIQQGAKAVEGATVAQRVFNGVLKASGIGLLVGLLASVIAYFGRWQAGIDKVSQLMAGLDAAINTVIVRVAGLGSAVVKLFTGDFAGAAADAKAAVTGIGSAILDAASAAYELEKRIQALRDTTITVSAEISRQRVQLDQYRQVVDDGTQAIGRRIAAQKQAAAIDADIARKQFDIALEQQQIAEKQFLLSIKGAGDKQKLQEANQRLDEAQIKLNQALYGGEKEARDLRKEAAEEQKKASEKRLKALEDERKALEALNKDLQKLRLAALGDGLDADLLAVEQKYDELIKTAQDGVDRLNEIESKRGLTPEEQAKRKEFADLTVKIEEQRLSAILDVLTEYNEKEISIQEEQQKRKEALAKKDYDTAVKSLETEKALRDQQIQLNEQQNIAFLNHLRAQGESEEKVRRAGEELDTFIQAARLNNELQFQESLLALTDKGNKDQVAQIEATIDIIKAKIKNLQPEPGKKPLTIFGLLGIDDKDGQEAVKKAVASVLDSINQISQARIEAAQAEVQAIDEKIAKQEEAVKKEEEYAKDGLANSLNIEKTRLAELKKQRDAALKEEVKAKKAQFALDTIQQSISLITASANIFKALSPLPFGAGVPIAIGLIAAMFGAFIAAKAKAAKAIEVPKFRKGTKLTGRTHEQGGNPITDGSGNIIGEAEKDEWLIGTEPSREHDRFLNRLNKGEFKGVDLERALPKSGRYINPADGAARRIGDIERRRTEATDARQWSAMKAAYSEGAERIVNAINEKPEVMPWKNGYKLRVKKGGITNIETVVPSE